MPEGLKVRYLTWKIWLTGAVEAAGPDPLVVVVWRHDAVEDLLLLLAVVDLLRLRSRPVSVVEHAPASENARFS